MICHLTCFTDGFIEEEEIEEEAEADRRKRAADHQRLDRQRQELSDQDLARMASEVKQRYVRSAARYHSDMDQVPQRLLMPSVTDPNLWQIRVKVLYFIIFLPLYPY